MVSPSIFPEDPRQGSIDIGRKVERLKRWIQCLAGFFVVVYLLPAALAVGWWGINPHPDNWRAAKWNSAGILPPAILNHAPSITVFSATTGGLKGALSVHSWIVIKERGSDHYDRYDVVGWGQPVRKNAYAADAYWYSNTPQQVIRVTGDDVDRMIEKLQIAIADYPYDFKGGYRLWPGPNSNSFVADILRHVPEIGAVLPPNATGRDFLRNGQFIAYDRLNHDLKLSVFGLAGLSIGRLSGFEINILGLVAGFDIARPGIKIPAWGTFHLDRLVM